MENMVQGLIPAIIVGFFTVLLIYILKALNWVWFRPKKLEKRLKRLGFSGNSYKLFHGDMKEQFLLTQEALSKSVVSFNDYLDRTLPFHLQTIKKHGKRSFIWVGPTPKLIIMESSFIKEILKDYDTFQKAKGFPIGRMLVRGLISLEGDEWRQRRRALNPIFHFEKLKQMLPAFHTSCENMVQKWEILAEKNETFEVDIWNDFGSLTADVISRTAFGSNYEEGKKLFDLLREQLVVMHMIYKSHFYLPILRFIPTKPIRRMKELYYEIINTLKGMIVKRQKSMMDGEAPNKDLLGLLLESSMNEVKIGKHSNPTLSFDHVIDECKLFYFAGQETTSTSLVWTTILLATYQDWQTRARNEVFDILGTKEPNFDNINHLKVVTMILYEALRMYPPVLEMVRVVEKQTTFGDLVLPAGVHISLPMLLIQRDKEVWGNDADQFNPERFSEGVLKATSGNTAFLPFSYGPRVCIGQNFALLESKMAIAMILQRFSFKLSPSYIHAPANQITLQPQHGARVVFTKL